MVGVERVEYFVRELPLRMPFDYGDVTVTERPLLFARVTADVDGERARGVASETMAARWFVRGASFEGALDAMLDVVDAARRHARAAEGETAFKWWRGCYDRQRRWGERTDHPPLLWAFGASLVERGLLDAWCRARGTTLARAARDGALGIDLGAVYDELDGYDPGDLLPEPRRSIAVRHTVGHTDPLTDDDIPTGDRLDDGLPQSLADYVDTDGVSYFKVKLVGDPGADVARAREVAAAVDARCPDPTYTVDANEGYADLDTLARWWADVRAEVPDFADGLATIEQPLPRDAAMTDALRDWDGPPVIIDESDGRLRSLGRALEHGYAGTSHKNCKGVLKGIANACLIEHRNRTDDREYVMTAEDLLNVGPVALLQDLAVVATLGIDHAERNGHHYVRGLEFLPEAVQRQVLDAHGDLYREHPDGFPTLAVRDGRIDVGSLVDAPFGVGVDLDPGRFEPLDAWRP